MVFFKNYPNWKYKRIPSVFPDRGPYGVCGISGCGKINLVPHIVISMATTQTLGCQKINTILVVAFFMCDIERQISYQITALPEFYKIEF